MSFLLVLKKEGIGSLPKGVIIPHEYCLAYREEIICTLLQTFCNAVCPGYSLLFCFTRFTNIAGVIVMRMTSGF